MKEHRTIFDYFWRLILVLYSLAILFPLFWIISKSLQTNREFFQGAWSLPDTLKWVNYVKVWKNLSIPGIVTLAIFNFLGLYNDFLLPFMFLDDPKKYTIGTNMYTANTLMQFKADWVTLCAGVIIAMAPSVIAYILFQKQVMEGATLGSLKG